MLTIFLLRKADIINGTWLRRLAKTAIYLIFTMVFSIVICLLLQQVNNFVISHPSQSDKEADAEWENFMDTYAPANIEKQSKRSLKKMYNYYPHTTKISRKYFSTTTLNGKKQILSSALQYRDIESLVAICYKEPTNINKDYVFTCAYKLGLNKDDDITPADSLVYYDQSLTKADQKYVTPQLHNITSKLYSDTDDDDDDDDVKPTAYSKFMDWATGWLNVSIRKGWPDNFEIIFLLVLASLIFYFLYGIALPKPKDLSNLSKLYE